MRRKIIYQSNGMSLCFGDKMPYFLEKINAESLAGVFSADTLLGSTGQFTTSKSFGGRTVTCEFAIAFLSSDMRYFKKGILRKVLECFNPTIEGVLTVITDGGEWEIACYPSEVPSFDNSKTADIYRFSVDLICDYPYFKNKRENTVSLTASTSKTIKTHSAINIPFQIVSGPFSNLAVTNTTTGKTAKFTTSAGVEAVFDTGTLEYKQHSTGTDISQYIDVTSDFDEMYLVPGENVITANYKTTIVYHDYVLGVI